MSGRRPNGLPTTVDSTDFAGRALRFLQSLVPPGFRPAVSYASAPAGALFAATIQYALLPKPSVAPFVFFYFSIAFVAWVAGRGPGLATVLCSAVVGNWLFLEPYGQFSVTSPALTATVLFVVSSGAVALLCAGFRDALLQAQRTAAELREDKDALRVAHEQLRELDQRKNEFLGVLSHELRNPLAAIRMSMSIAARVVPGSNDARRSFAVIDRQVRQLTRLVDDLLDVTRISRGKVRLQHETVDLRALATQAAQDYLSLFEKNGLQLDVSLEDKPLLVHGDSTRIAQILGNLLQNAAKFTSQGDRTTLSIKRTDDGFAEVSVQDTGPGIPSDVLPSIFEPFVQAEKTLERSASGLGLGLALVKGLVELHGGSVSAENLAPGGGAKFVVCIPLDRRKLARPTQAAIPTARSRARRVLVVEDNIDAAESLKEALELDSHTVALAHTGSEGIQKARSFKPDVVLCDIGLPVMNGFEVAKAMRADPELRSATLIAVSGYALPEDVERAKASGFDLHLTKPIELSVLERAMAEVSARPRPP